MQLYTGHPRALKKAFLEFLQQHKQSPFDKVLVVLPSRRLEAALKRAAAGAGVASALYFTDFLQLSLDICARSTPLVPNDYRQDFILKNILQKYGHAAARPYALALKSSLRDLAAAQVSPGDLINLKNDESLLDAPRREALGRLAVLYNDFLARLKMPGRSTYYEAFQAAALSAAPSAYLKGFKKIIFYGFYDFTAIQLDLFKAVDEACGCAVFYPYEPAPAYKFAQNFYESFFLARAKEIKKLPPPPGGLKELADNLFNAAPAKTPGAPVKIISVCGPEAEVQAACKEILRLRAELGLDYGDIALAARSLEPYKSDLPRLLAQNLIPARFSFDTPLAQHPLGAFIYNLFTLAQNNFYRDDVLAVAMSPYFKNRQNSWQKIIKNIGVTSGYAQWLDLLSLAPAEQARPIAAFLERIKTLLARVSQGGGFAEQAQNARDIINEFLTEDLDNSESAILSSIHDLLAQLQSFADIRPQAEPGEFLQEFCALISEQGFAVASSQHPRGVAVADIMALRGQDFKAIIIIGLNEGVLPAPAQEDPVLKDIYRKTLQKLGFLLHARADRYDEEKLLFYLALTSAGECATLIYQRSGDDGKPKIPSLYLTQILGLLGQSLEENKNFILSRRPGEKYKQWPQEFLDSQEAALLAAHSPQTLVALTNADAAQTARYLAVGALAGARALTPYDGVVRPGNAVAQSIAARGISPSDLMVFYKCPARFLFERITHKEEERPFERGALSPLNKGILYHEILENFYKYLKQNKLYDKLFAVGAKNILQDFAKEYFAPQNHKKYGIYPVAWQAAAARMLQNLQHFVEEDLKLLQTLGLEPQMFEEKLEAQINLPKRPLKLRGKLDRIDMSPGGKTYRIADYKTKRASGDIKKAIFAAGALQPPLYFEMAQNHPALKAAAPLQAALLAVEAPGAVDKTLTYEEYQTFRPRFLEMVQYLANLADDGVFIITPSDNSCQNCRFDTLCRKQQHAAAMRAANAPAAKKLKDYHATK